MEAFAPANDEAVEAWNGPLFDRFVRFRHIVTTGLGAHGDAALAACPPAPGARVLDIGCGFGDTVRRLARIVGPSGEVVGVDVAERFVETARREARDTGIANVRVDVRDVENTDFDGERFDYAFSRFGTMFFADPVAATSRSRSARRSTRPSRSSPRWAPRARSCACSATAPTTCARRSSRRCARTSSGSRRPAGSSRPRRRGP